MDGVICLILIALTILVSLKRLSYGFCLFLGIRILVPESVRFLETNISLNTVVILVLLIMTFFSGIEGKKLRYDKKLVMGLSLFCFYCLGALLLSDKLDHASQINYLVQFIITEVVPIIICCFAIKTESDIKVVAKAFLITCILTGIYGVLSFLIQENPYLMFWSDSNSVPIDAWYGNYTTSTFVSTNSFGYFIGLSVPFVVFLYANGIHKKYAKVALCVLIPCAILCKKRTTIIVLIVYFIMLFLSSNFKEKKKYILWGVPIVVVILALIFTVPSFESARNVIVTSVFFWDDSVYNKVTMGAGGSNWALRMRQFIYPFIEIKSNYLFGHGIGWCSTYLSKGSIHPVLFGFENLISQLICEFGLMAIPLFTYVFKNIYKYVNNRHKNKYVLIFFISSIVQMIGTGAVYWYLELTILLLMKMTMDKVGNNRRVYESKSINNPTCL